MASIYDWSTTAGNNATADADINWSEGQFPSTVNDSARQMMGRQAEWLKDNGIVAATGTANAIALGLADSLTTPVNGMTVGFKALASNTGAVTLSINGGGGLPLRKVFPGTAEAVALDANDIAQSGVYLAHYDASANAGVGAWIIINPTNTAKFAASDNYLKLSGGTMTGPIALAGAPTADLQPATKKYVDDLGATKAGLAANNNFTGINDFRTQITVKADGFPQYRLTNAAGNAASIYYVDTTTNFARIETYTFAGAVWNSFSIEGGGDSAFKMNGKIAWNKGNLPEGAIADISGSNTVYKVFTGAMLESRIQAVAQAWVPFQAAGYFSTTIADNGYTWQNATGKPVMITGRIATNAGVSAQAEISSTGAAYEQIAGAVAAAGTANFSIMIPPGWFFRFLSTVGTSGYSLRLQRV